MRIFISSTWKDLQPERQAVETSLHRMRGAEFAGMEYFSSNPNAPMEKSLAEVDASDVYIGILAHRYGSGITEAEYRRARKLGIPCLIYLKDENVAVLPTFIEEDNQKRYQLDALKQEIKKHHTISFFETPDQLAALVTTDLYNLLPALQRNKGGMQWPGQASTLPTTSINVSGDFILGDKTGGDKINVENISNSNLAVGQSASVSASEDGTVPTKKRGMGRQDPTIIELHRLLIKQFNLEELQSLCFNLGVDFEEIGGSSKSAKARELVLYMERRDQLDRLREAIEQRQN